MKILFIGGNGNISWWCVQRAIEKGYEVWELNRAMTRKTRRPIQQEVHQIICDVRNYAKMREALEGKYFDVVCDFISYNGKQAEQMLDLFINRTYQYIVISSEAVYKRQFGAMPFCEDSEKYCLDEVSNCSYIRGKIEVENCYESAYRDKNFPATIVRPGYTYDMIIPTPAGENCFTAIQKIKEGNPMIMYGDGNNLWAPMHSSDFSRYFIELFGKKDAIGECYHIVGQELLSWNQMEQYVMEAFQVEKQGIIHIPEEDVKMDSIFKYDELTKQHMSDYIFDNKKIDSLVQNEWEKISFKDGIKKTVELLSNRNFRRINENVAGRLDRIYKKYCI